MDASRSVRAAFGVLLCGCALAGAAERARSRPASQPTTRWSPDRIAELVEQLGHKQWTVRERATAALQEDDLTLLEPLGLAYRGRRPDEVTLRIKRVVEHLVMSAALGQAGGFLGVRQRVISRADDPRVPEGQRWVLVVEVLANTAAAAAGLQANDIIVAMDGKPLGPKEGSADFPKRIALRPPGAGIDLAVRRGDSELHLTATLGPRPPAYADKRTETYARAQAEFAKIWREQFDPNDRTVESPEAAKARRERTRKDQILELRRLVE